MADNGTGNEDFRRHLIRYGGDTYGAIVEKAQGCYVFDADGRKILDFTSGQMCATVGHNHPNIVAAIRKSCDTALHLFSGMIPRSVVQLASAIAKLVPLSKDSQENDTLHDLARAGLVRLGTGKLPAGFWKLPRPKDRKGRGLKAILTDRSEER